MDGTRPRRVSGRRSGAVAAGSVWESRMKLDEVKGGIKVFNGDDVDDKEREVGRDDEKASRDEDEMGLSRKLRRSPVGVAGKRKTWKSETNFEGFKSSPVQVSKLRSESTTSDAENSPIQTRRKLRSEPTKKPNSENSVPEVTNKVVEGPDRDEEACKEFGVVSSNNVSHKPEENAGDGGEEEDEEEEFEDMMEEEEILEVEKKSIDVKEINVPEPEQKPKKVVVIEEKKIGQLNTKPVTIASTLRTQPVHIRSSTIYQKNNPPTNSTPVSDQHKRFPHTQNKLQSLVDLVMWRDVSRSAFIFGIGTFAIVSSSYTQDLNISFISIISYLGLVYLAAIFLYKSIIRRGVIDTDDASYVVGEGDAVWLLKLFVPYLNEFLLKLRALFSGDPSTTMKLAVLLFVLARCGSSITIWTLAKFVMNPSSSGFEQHFLGFSWQPNRALGFFGVFTVPKVCSSYSTLITAYGKFWIRRFRDAWESCTHKKAVAFAIFTLVWNLSSIVARIWAVFMLFVAIRYYQQSMMVRDQDWVDDDTTDTAEVGEETWKGRRQAQNGVSGRQHGNGPTNVELKKTKEGS